MITLNDIAVLHDKWINVACKAGLSVTEAQDVVQDVYLYFGEKTCLDKYEWNGKLNEYYVLKVVRSRSLDFLRAKTRRRKSMVYDYERDIDTIRDFEELPVHKDTDHQEQEVLNNVSECVRDAFKNMSQDKKWNLAHILFTILTDERPSVQELNLNIAKISRESGISKHILYNERKKAQKYICKECGEQDIEKAWPST